MRKTNTEFLADLMDFGDPMKQMIIMEAVARYAANVVAELDPDNPPEGWPGLINPHAWHRAATEINTAMNDRAITS